MSGRSGAASDDACARLSPWIRITADAGVVGAEGDFAFLRAVRDDAHLGAAEVAVEQVLER
jgi:hypothetical protein